MIKKYFSTKTKRTYLLFSFWFITTVLLSYTPSSLADVNVTLFTTPNEAQTHCPNDEVVWLNLPTKVWHTKWQRWYGQTKNGAYVCKGEAIATGNRASRRG